MEAACRYLVSEQGWGRHGIAEMGERRQAQGESVMRYQVDLPQLQENTRTVLGAGLGECSSAFSTASDSCAVSAAPVTCTPPRVCSSFSEYGSPQRAVPKYRDYPPQWQGKPSSRQALSVAVLFPICLLAAFVSWNFIQPCGNLLQPPNGYGRLRSGADLSILGIDHKGPCCLQRWKINKTDRKLVCFLLCTCKQGL